MQYTEALNALLIQSDGPLFVALWTLALFGVRLTGAQARRDRDLLVGGAHIILRGDWSALAGIRFNRGDLMFGSSLRVRLIRADDAPAVNIRVANLLHHLLRRDQLVRSRSGNFPPA